jgi:hypothetical protein
VYNVYYWIAIFFDFVYTVSHNLPGALMRLCKDTWAFVGHNKPTHKETALRCARSSTESFSFVTGCRGCDIRRDCRVVSLPAPPVTVLCFMCHSSAITSRKDCRLSPEPFKSIDHKPLFTKIQIADREVHPADEDGLVNLQFYRRDCMPNSCQVI